MKSFDVLNRKQLIARNHLLQASAGTGKTYSIENIVLRLLLEEPVLDLEEILVVTFTRASTHDLKLRIRQNIEKALCLLRQEDKSLPDFFQPLLEAGKKEGIVRKLEHALLAYDKAQIYTIHGFCAAMLNLFGFESGMSLKAVSVDETATRETQLALLHDFFRTEVHAGSYSRGELNMLLGSHNSDLQKLEQDLLDHLARGMEIAAVPSLSERIASLSCQMKALKEEHGLTAAKIMEDFDKRKPLYKKVSNHWDEVKTAEQERERVAAFASLFDRDIWGANELDLLLADKLYLAKLFAPNNRSKRTKAVQAAPPHFPQLDSLLAEHLGALVEDKVIFARMAGAFQKFLQKHQEQEQTMGFDDMVKALQKGLANKEFLQRVRGKYRAAIVDEFQDTDPVQWEIFQTLFLSAGAEGCYLYIVGDPKQSIYAFRQADIYTYLQAADAIGLDNSYSLDTNYRSQGELVTALNALFAHEASPNLFQLPKSGNCISYPLVKSKSDMDKVTFKDDRGALHFFVGESIQKSNIEEMEQEQFFPFIAAEIQRLHRRDGQAYHQFAVVIADKHQARRLAEYLNSKSIPAVTQRSSSLVDSPALTAMRELLQAFVNPRNLSALKTALSGRAIRWRDEEIVALSELERLQNVLFAFQNLRKTYRQEGFASFYRDFLQTSFGEGRPAVAENLLGIVEGDEFLQEFNQIGELLIAKEQSLGSMEGMIRYLEELEAVSNENDNTLKVLKDLSRNAVTIITMHSCKGLEFDVVFAMGLIKPSPELKGLIPVEIAGKCLLTPWADQEDERYLQYVDELDAEKIRQLYVAMTRAKNRLYVPVWLKKAGTKRKRGQASPMELFLARFCQPEPLDAAELYARINDYDGAPLDRFLMNEGKSCGITFSKLKDYLPNIADDPEREAVVLAEPETVVIPGDNLYVHSFSSIAKGKVSTPQESAEDKTAPHDFDNSCKTAHTLPSGSETGNILHRILEEFDFEQAATRLTAEEYLDIVRPYIKGSPYEAWEEVFAEILYRAMHTELIAGFALKDIAAGRCFKETEFLFHSPVEGFPGYCKGFIDLLFAHDGKYYLLDWKSNWLGNDPLSYGEESLRKAMEQHQYSLQAQIYTDALRAYLRIVDKRPFEKIFGGVFYVFLRGLPEGILHLEATR